ncbi:MAG: mobilization protein MobD [Gammaproteobacteria bacterium]
MSTIHFIGGEKGGIGKSVVSRLLSQYFLDHHERFAGFDADQSHATLSRYYADFVRPLNLDYFESTDAIMETALEADLQVLIDLPAQSQRFLDRWLDENSVLEMCAEMNIPLIYWYAVDDGPDSVQLLDKFLDKYAGMLNCVVVKNEGVGSDFSQLETMLGSRTGIHDDKLIQVHLPALHGPTMHKVNKLNFSFWAATHMKSTAGPHLSLMERQRSKVWLKKSYAVVDGVLNELIVAEEVTGG